VRHTASLLLLAACSSSPPYPEFAGDPALPLEVELSIRDVSGGLTTLADGMRVPLIEGPQGGKHIFVAVRARNLYTGAVELMGLVRDGTVDGQDPILGLEKRPVDFALAADGWAYPVEPDQLSSYSNIALCPNYKSSRDIYEEAYQVTVEVEDRSGRRGGRALMVTPYCGVPAEEQSCRCQCAHGYHHGQCTVGPNGSAVLASEVWR